MSKRIFIVMYNFMPIGIGRGIAWNEFAEKLKEAGYDVEIVTVNPSKFDPYYNADKIKMISKNIRVVRLNDAKFYYKLYSHKVHKNFSSLPNKKNFIKRSLINIYKTVSRIIMYPDRMKFWSIHAKKYLLSKNINSNDIIISVGFPFSTHLQMKKIKRKKKCKLILDYGDPWSFNPSIETEPIWRKKIDFLIEKNLVKEADLITVTTDTTKQMFQNKFKIENIFVIRQGVDLSAYLSQNKQTKNDIITLAYTGIFYKEIRDPTNFFDALIEVDKKIDFNVDIKIAGMIDNYFTNIILTKKTTKMKHIKINLLGNIVFSECIKLQKSADILLFFSNKNGIQVPGKLYEYLATDRPILCISYEYGETEKILLDNKRGIVLYNNDIQAMATKLFDIVMQYKNEGKVANVIQKQIFDYDWSNISKQLVQVIDEVSKNE